MSSDEAISEEALHYFDRPRAAFSLDASSLRQRHVPLREDLTAGVASSAPHLHSHSQSSNIPSYELSSQPLDDNKHVSNHNSESEFSSEKKAPDVDDDGIEFECNICLDTASNPVITMCGHLFCWPCLHQWMGSNLESLCPVCKSAVTKSNVIPVFARGRAQKDPRNDTPERPAGHRQEPTRQSRGSMPATFQFGGQTFSLNGIGPLGPFGFQFV
ncbi:hypothetical protein HK096_008207, partial [Nowakowskiella sp. JEL0078]